MNEELRKLIQLQDLDHLIRETSDPRQAKELQTLGFEMTGIEKLKTARSNLAQSIDRRYLLLYERLAQRHGRAVVPVEDRTCLGCFQGVPRSFYSDITADQPVKVCENCGRILYLLTS
jgi:predicted  nucleic acid-binding Zn-ribbon protein